MKDEVVTNILVKAMTQFPSPQFSLALHLINPSAAATGELAHLLGAADTPRERPADSPGKPKASS